MPTTEKRAPATDKRASAAAPAERDASQRTLDDKVQAALRSLKHHASKRVRDDMAPRYGIISDKAFGVPMAKIKLVAKAVGRNHELAAALWKTGWYEARLLASFVAEPERVTPAQMDRWCQNFDNWAVCDTVCFHLFDRTPHAFQKVAQWAGRRDEFVRRAAFALLASLALHGKQGDNEAFLRCLPLIESAAEDERNFVKKGVNWALRAIGARNAALHDAAMDVARRLSSSSVPSARWIGKDALKELAKRRAR